MDTDAAAAQPAALTGFWNRFACSVGGHEFLWIDVTLAAMVRGGWPAFERRLAEGLACAARADRDESPDQDVIEEAATAFRYERDLISGADVDAWLANAGLTIDDWMAYLQRDVLRRSWSDQLDEILDAYPPTPRDSIAAAVAEGICSRAFEEFARTFAQHAALVCEEDRETFARVLAEPNTGDPRIAQLMHVHADWLSMRPSDDTASRLAILLLLDDACAAVCDRLASPERLAGIVDVNRLDWIELELETVSFATAAAAQEAVFCVKDDGESLADVAALSHQTVDRRSVLIDELAADARDRLLSAEPGDLLGPIAVNDRFDVTVVLSRRAPSLANPRIAARARQAVLESALEHAERAHVTRSHRD